MVVFVTLFGFYIYKTVGDYYVVRTSREDRAYYVVIDINI